ncbi:uncharacterized protein LOC128895639 [Hylaeus anthracinus]|uniref:uncharacterized protein LOC128895639 n=1 Tax=Hylaeus anthracinus TaxID=313031 RepID=UPI0023B8C1F1|nr:uncharacterized protein LOC128895639 [Hylaeus anthracinus]
MRATKQMRRRQKEKKRALYVRLPHVIRKEEDVAKLFTGDFKVELTRQSSRHCYVIFANDEEKMKNLKASKNVLINGKRVLIAPAVTKIQKPTHKVVQKKIVIPEVKENLRVTRTLFVSNIECGTRIQELREAIPGCVTIKMLKPYSGNLRGAMVKLESPQMAAEYLSQIREWPVVRNRKLKLKPDTRIRHRKPKSGPLKIYDSEPEDKEDSSEIKKDETVDYIAI